MKYQSLNVLNQKKRNDYMSDDCIQEVANMINSHSGTNRAQRKRLERALNKVENIYRQTQKRVDRSAFKSYMQASDENMRTFFAILGIVMVKNYGWKNEDGCEQVEELYDILNSYLDEYQEYTVDEVCKICESVTGVQLISE